MHSCITDHIRLQVLLLHTQEDGLSGNPDWKKFRCRNSDRH